MRKVFYDTEFIDDGQTIEFLSIGMVDDVGRIYYAITDDEHSLTRAVRHEFLREHVVPHLPVTVGSQTIPGIPETFHHVWEWDKEHPEFRFVKPRSVIRQEVQDFLVPVDSEEYQRDSELQLWADYCAYDYVVLAQLFGPLTELPPGIPFQTDDIETLRKFLSPQGNPPEHRNRRHHALDDARHDLEMYHWIKRNAFVI